MIVIFPSDPSTKFLAEIVEGITKKTNIEIELPTLTTYEDAEKFIEQANVSKTIIYLGHGTSDHLEAGSGLNPVLTSHAAKKIFKNKKLILFSCYSSDFLSSLDNIFLSAIGFGNIRTSQAELNSYDSELYKHNGYEPIRFFREQLIRLFLKSIIEAYENKYSFIQLYNSLKLRINKIICSNSLSKEDETAYLVGKLMCDLKKEMMCIGNPIIPLT
jgi:hypothetical protein